MVFSSHQLELVERLCEAVAIINRGRLVAAGRVAELRAGRQRRFQVGVDGDGVRGAGGAAPSPDEWWAGLPGVRLVDKTNGRVVLELDEGVDEQGVLDAARAAGRVTLFSPREATLTELFRRAVEA